MLQAATKMAHRACDISNMAECGLSVGIGYRCGWFRGASEADPPAVGEIAVEAADRGPKRRIRSRQSPAKTVLLWIRFEVSRIPVR
jgi:hypothetical protein